MSHGSSVEQHHGVGVTDGTDKRIARMRALQSADGARARVHGLLVGLRHLHRVVVDGWFNLSKFERWQHRDDVRESRVDTSSILARSGSYRDGL